MMYVRMYIRVYLLVSTYYKVNNLFIMATIYYLAIKRSRNYSIVMEISLGRNNQPRFSTGITINHKNNLHKNKIREVQAENNPKKKNYHLRALKNYVEEQIVSYQTDGIDITRALCKDIVKSFGGTSPLAKKENNEFNLLKHIDDFIEKIKAGLINNDINKRYSKNAIDNFCTMRGHMYEYERVNGKITPPKINNELIRNVQRFLAEYINEKGNKKTLINTSINKNVAMLKTFLNRYVINEDYLNIKLRYYKSDGVKQLPSDNKGKPLTYLNINEVKQLWKHNLSEREPQYTVVRDMWVFIALTCGIRVDDYLNLDAKQNVKYVNIQGQKILALCFEQSKTGEPVVAPIGSIGEQILKQYNGELPKANEVISRKLIKKICKWAGIDETVYANKIKGQETPKYKKWELVGNHTARRSFCTNAYKMGVSEHKIMQISGHADREQFFGYILTTKEENAKMFSETKYFKAINEIDTPVLQAV